MTDEPTNEPTDDQVDADLKSLGYDSAEAWPEYGHDALRDAWRAGYEHAALERRQRKPQSPVSPETVRREADLARKKLAHVQQRREE